MKKTIFFMMISLNSWALTLDELIKLEQKFDNTPMAPTSFIQECHDLVSREGNPRHIQMLSKILEIAKNNDKDAVKTLLKEYESVLRSE